MTASNEIDRRIKDLGDWRGQVITLVRRLIHEAEPNVIEDMKWRKPSNSMSGVPVWSKDGIICTGEHYKDKVKFTFAKGAALPDPTDLFNSSLDGNTRRAIDIFAGDEIDEVAMRELVKSAVRVNLEAKKT